MKSIKYLLITVVAVIILAALASIGIASALKVPVPYISDIEIESDWNYQNYLMEQWRNVKVFTPEAEPQSVEEIIEKAVSDTEQSDIKQTEPQEINDFYTKFNEIDKNTLEKYLKDNPDTLVNGYDKLLIDKATIENKPTGIKTKNGDDVLVIDAYDSLIIIGTEINGQNVKVAILKNKSQVDFSVVQNLVYWDKLHEHAKAEAAIFAISASDYVWNKAGNYGTLYGAAVRHGDVIRKYVNKSQLVGFTKDGDMLLGDSVDIENIYNACEGLNILINGSEQVYIGSENENREARTAIGQRANGDIIFITVDGDDSTTGATLSELTGLLIDYGAVKAVNLAGSYKSLMWWNGRIINKCSDWEDQGIRLPDAWVIKSASK